MSLCNPASCEWPSVFQTLMNNGLIGPEHIRCTGDQFFMIAKSLASILSANGIDTFPDREGQILDCGNYFDDWFLYAVSQQKEPVYGLVKMREQEFDQDIGIQADGDTPGVTISFIPFHCGILTECLKYPSAENRKALGAEINRVVAYPLQSHHPALKAYFVRPQAEAPYLIAETYVNHIAAFCTGGALDVPKAYAEIYKNRGLSGRFSRIPDFLDQNNRNAGKPVCDHRKIYIQNPQYLSHHEKLAILATHTGNVSVHSFAAEVRYHALFLSPFANIRIPFLGNPYASAIRADMSIGDKEFQGPAPYYNLSGRLVLTHMKYHTSATEGIPANL